MPLQLNLHTTCDATPELLSELLWIDFIEDKHSSVISASALIGPIEVSICKIMTVNHLILGNELPWKAALDFNCHTDWDRTRMLLVLEMCEDLHSKYEGFSFARYDNGSPLFAIRGENIFLTHEMKAFYSNIFSPICGHTYYDFSKELL